MAGALVGGDPWLRSAAERREVLEKKVPVWPTTGVYAVTIALDLGCAIGGRGEIELTRDGLIRDGVELVGVGCWDRNVRNV